MMTKTYDVPFQGRVDYTVRVQANNPSEAITRAREMRDKLNLKSEIFVNGWFDDECEDDVEEIDVVTEQAMMMRGRYLSAKMDELGDEKYFKNQDTIIKEYDAMLKMNEIFSVDELGEGS
tara:strand:- start:196 stop:555 length:360 start_codon:yes stop_codon:yes gene_type:complete